MLYLTFVLFSIKDLVPLPNGSRRPGVPPAVGEEASKRPNIGASRDPALPPPPMVVGASRAANIRLPLAKAPPLLGPFDWGAAPFGQEGEEPSSGVGDGVPGVDEACLI